MVGSNFHRPLCFLNPSDRLTLLYPLRTCLCPHRSLNSVLPNITCSLMMNQSGTNTSSTTLRPAPMVSDPDLAAIIHNFLLSSDLKKTSNGSVRRKLEHDFGIDLSDRKAFIREQVDIFLQSQYDDAEVYGVGYDEVNGGEKGRDEDDVSESEVEEHGEDVGSDSDGGDVVAVLQNGGRSSGKGGSSSKGRSRKPKKEANRRGAGFTKMCVVSPQLGKLVGASTMPRPQIIKQLWNYIREKKLQDPNDGKNVLCDELLYDIFGADSVNILKMNKYLSKHITPLDSDTAPVKPVQKEKHRKQGRKEDSDEAQAEAKKPKRKASGFLAPKRLSDSLVRFIGTGEDVLTRAEVIKKIWEHIKEKKLQDPSDRKRILCDDKLRELFNVDSFDGFTVTKLLTGHFVKL